MPFRNTIFKHKPDAFLPKIGVILANAALIAKLLPGVWLDPAAWKHSLLKQIYFLIL